MAGTESIDRRSVLKTLGAGAAGVAGVTGVGSAADYDNLSVWIYWADGSGDFGFSSKPSGQIDEVIEALESELAPQVNFDINAYDDQGLTSPTEWKRGALEDEGGSNCDDSKLTYCDILSEFKQQLSEETVIGTGLVNLLLYNSEPDDPAKTGAADTTVKSGKQAANVVVGNAPRDSLGVQPFQNTVIHEVGHTLSGDHTDGETWYDSSSGVYRATPMITWYTGSHCDGYQSVSSSCDGDSPNPTCYHTYELSSCSREKFNCWMRCEYDGECSCCCDSGSDCSC